MNLRPLVIGLGLAALCATNVASAQQRATDAPPAPSAAPAPAAPAQPATAGQPATAAQTAAETRTVARLREPKGTVLVSRGDAMVAGAANQRLPVGARIVTTAGATVTIDYDKGCDVRMAENQRFVVREGDCAALVAAVEPIAPTTAAGAAAGGTGRVSGLGLGALGVAGVAAAIIANDDDRGPNAPAPSASRF